MKNTFPVPHKIIESKTFLGLSQSAKVLLFILYKLTNRFKKDNGWFYRSINALCRDTGMNYRTLKRAKAELVESGLIEIFNSTPQHSKETMFRVANQKEIKCTPLKK